MTNEATSKRVMYTMDGTSDVLVQHETYPSERGPLAFHLFRPPLASVPCGAVVLVTGFADPAAATLFGRPFMEWASYRDWARLLAASGVAAITYVNREPGDVVALVRHLRAHAAALGLDPHRLGAWACSGNVPNALALVARERLAAAALLYGYPLDLDGAREVAQASAHFHFAAPPLTLDDVPRDVPLLVVRAGRDETPGLDASLARFVSAARTHELSVEEVVHADAPHAFDLLDDSPRTREVIADVLAFLVRTLC